MIMGPRYGGPVDEQNAENKIMKLQNKQTNHQTLILTLRARNKLGGVLTRPIQLHGIGRTRFHHFKGERSHIKWHMKNSHTIQDNFSKQQTQSIYVTETKDDISLQKINKIN